MSEPVAHENFDPYHKWLGISPKDQPPHHYRLLAIDVFESDADVISAAADKQMAFIRSFQTGKNAQFSQKILNEIATARVCLLNAAKKAEYDAALRAHMAAAGTETANPTSESVVDRGDAAAAIMADLADLDMHGPLPLQLGGSQRARIRKKKSTSARILPLLALGAMLVVCGVAIAVVMSRTPETHVPQVAEDHDGSPAKSTEASRVKPPATVDNKPVPAKMNESNREPLTSPLAASPHDTSGDNRSDTKVPVGDNPVADNSDHTPKPETPVKPAEADKSQTPEELGKQTAAAKTPDDYRAVAEEGLRWAAKALDDHHNDLAKDLIRKALIAARKSGDSKVVFKVTRAMTKPESIKEILAEQDN